VVSPPRVVVVADDFGRSAAINAGILRAFEAGLISEASLMANMPGFGEAVREAHRRGLLGCIGVHLNLHEGPALTSAILACPRFTRADGTLCWTHRNVLALSALERHAVAEEWRAQIQRVVHAGIAPTHLDSHHHIHTAWPLGTITLDLAREFGIPCVRLSRNCGPRPGWLVRLYKKLFNRRLRQGGFSPIRFFGAARDVATVLAGASGPVEVMTHPQLTADGRLVDHLDGTDLAGSLGFLDRRSPLPFSGLGGPVG